MASATRPKGKTGASCAERGNMVNVTQAIKVDEKIALLGRFNGAMPEGGINIKGGGLCVWRRINDDGCYLLKCTPVAAEVGHVNLGVERPLKPIITGI